MLHPISFMTDNSSKTSPFALIRNIAFNVPKMCVSLEQVI